MTNPCCSVKVLSVALLISIAANIGIIAWATGKKAGEARTMRREFIEAFVDTARDLPTEKREAAKEILRNNGPQLKESLHSVREQVQAVKILLEQDEIDTPALETALTELRTRSSLFQEKKHTALLEILPYMPAEQRRNLIEKQGKILR